MSLLEIKNLIKEFPLGFLGKVKLRAVDNVSFELSESKVISLIGESGSGKTTIGKLILRLLKPTEGQIIFNGKDIKRFKPKDYYRNIQGIFQDPYSSFNPVYKIDRIFDLVFDEFMPEFDKKQRREEIEKILIGVGMNPLQILGKYPHQLSGGQLQRILIARTLLLKPKVLIADEIISMLDASTRVDILNFLGELKQASMSVIFITHDLSFGYYISDETIILYKGSIMEMGDTRKVFHNPIHPYTRMLLESVPTVEEKWSLKEDLVPEVLHKEVSGCKFYERCSEATDECKRLVPPLVEIEENHKAACIKSDSFVRTEEKSSESSRKSNVWGGKVGDD